LLIGIDGRALAGPRAGSGRYVAELCDVLDRALPQARFLVYGNVPAALPVGSPRWAWRGEERPWWRACSPFLWYLLRAGRLAGRDGVTAFWGGSNFLPLGLPRRVRAVVTVLDLVHRVFPQSMGAKHRLAFGAFFRAGLRRAEVVTSISAGTAGRLREWGYRGAEVVVRPGVSGRFVPPGAAAIAAMREALGLTGAYVLSVSTLEPRKNLAALVEAYLGMRAAGELSGVALVLVGQAGWKNAGLQAKIEEARAAGAEIRLAGHVPDELLPALYAGAETVVMPSIYEGFGLPVLEARCCGARVVAADIPEIREAGGEQVSYVAPTVAGIQAGIRRALLTPPPVSAGEDADIPRWEAEGAKLARALVAAGEAGAR
jgi:glycosyltransferase involved in cell wall biosynthesis